MEVEMKMVKSLLLGTAAGFVAVAGAQAADMPVKAAAVQYVKICSLYGDGFYYIPGTDTCLKMGGYLRIQSEYFGGGGGVIIGANAGGMPQQGREDRQAQNDLNHRVRGAISWDIRQQTEYGTLRTYIRFGAECTTPGAPCSGSTASPFWDRAFLQFAGFTVGKSQSFFDLVTYGGAYSLHNVRVSGDTGAAGQVVWAYTAQFGNGFSGTLSLEDPANRRVGTINNSFANFFAANAVTTPCNAFEDTASGAVCGAAAQFGMRVPDVILNARVDQQWGFAGVSVAMQDVSGAYYSPTTNGLVGGIITSGNVNQGHPADKLGWAAAAGAKFNLPGGDAIGMNVCGTIGAPGFCTNQNGFQRYNASTSVGLGWISDGVFGTGTDIELTRVWSALAFYEHIWNPRWRTAWGGGYVNISYNQAATNLINASLPGTGALGPGGTASVCFRGPPGAVGAFSFITPLAGNSCNPSWSFYELYTRTQWNPVQQLDIGVEILYMHVNTPYKGPAAVAANVARPVIGLIDDQNVWSAMFRWQRNFYP
jgi:Porin subfamily